MANPLAAFRKYQKILLAVFGVALILVFTVGGLVSQYQQASPGGEVENKVVVSWKDGEFRENQLQMQRFIRSQLIAFQRQVFAITQQRRGTPRMTVVPESNSEASIVQSMLLAREAQRLGVVVGDEAVLDYLTEQLSDKTIDRDELAKILRDSTGGRMTQGQLFDGLRQEMLARQTQLIASDSAITPGESFGYFKRLSRSMEAEVMPIAVADFVDQVSDEPTTEEIQEIYDDYKEVYPSKISPTPGLKRPKRAAFEWLKADFQSYLDRELAKVSDEQVLAYYEENKDSEYRAAELPVDDFNLESTVPNDSLDLESEPDAELDLVPPNDSDEENTGSATDAGVSVEPDEASTDEDAESSSPEVDPDAPSSELDSGEAADGDVPGGAGNDQIDDLDPESEAGAEPADPLAEGQSVAPSTDDSEPSAPAEGQPAAETADEDALDADLTDETESEVKYRPLKEVKDQIKEKIARPLATTAQSAAIDQTRAILRRYFEDYVAWEASDPEDRDPAPERPDFEQLAETHGMVSGEIPLARAIDVDEYELGRAFELDMNALQAGQLVEIPFAQKAYSDSLTPFNPERIRAAMAAAEFVYWKVDAEEEYTPTFDQANDEIVLYLKTKKAIKLARDKAEGYAKQLRESGSSLRQKFGDNSDVTITDTNEFTWMTYGGATTGQSMPRISTVEGVKYAGQQFMKDVAKLKSGESTVTIDYPETTVYVVYMKAVMGDQNNIQDEYLAQGLSMPVLLMARQDNMMAAAEWYESLEDDWQVEWQRPALRGSR